MDKNNKNKNTKIDFTPTAKALEIVSMKDALWDPLGSYTGVPKDENEVPTQDVDDL